MAATPINQNDHSISGFRENYLKQGLARPTRYYITFQALADGIGTFNGYQPENVVLPSRSMATINEHW